MYTHTALTVTLPVPVQNICTSKKCVYVHTHSVCYWYLREVLPRGTEAVAIGLDAAMWWQPPVAAGT